LLHPTGPTCYQVEMAKWVRLIKDAGIREE